MKIYVKKITSNSFQIIKETTTQSILTDLFTNLVLLVLVGADIAFSLMVGRSKLLDALVVILFIAFMFTGISHRKKIVTKDELIEIIND